MESRLGVEGGYDFVHREWGDLRATVAEMA